MKFNRRKSSLDVGLARHCGQFHFLSYRGFGVSEQMQVNFIPPFKTGLLFKT